MNRRLPFLVLAVLLTGATAVEAQSRSARDAYRAGLAHVQSGDTALALTELDRAVQLDPAYAAAHFQRGVLRARADGSGAARLEDRLAARNALREAVRLDPTNPRYLLELGKLLLSQEIRVDASRMFRRALEEAERADAPTLAEVHYQLALMREVQWVRFRSRHMLPMDVGQLSADMAFADPTFVWDMLDRSSFHQGQGQADREAMLEHLRKALDVDPGHAGAASHLLAHYYDEGLIDDFLAEARRFARAAPAEPRAYLALGVGLHALGREDEAAGAFQYGLELLDPALREDFESVARLMKKEDALAFDSLEGEARAEARRRFWTASDPLYLTPANEFWVEYLARMAYADLRFGLPEYGVPGWRTDRGDIYVRYGPPERVATFAPTTGFAGDYEAIGRVTTVWTYGRQGPVFVFRQNPGYRNATFANDFRFYAEDYRSIQPTRFTSPSLPLLVDLPAQVARFRGAAGATDLEVHAALPLDTLGGSVGVRQATLETGLFVLDPAGAEVQRLSQSEDVDFATDGARLLRSWRVPVPSGSPYLVAVEARDPLSWASAARRIRVEAMAFPAGEPSMSDLLLATTVEPLVEEPRARHDFRVTPEPTLRFRADRPVGLYFELYNLLPDAERFASYELEVVVTVEEIYREGPVRRLLGALADRWGVSELGDEPVQLRFGKEARVESRDLIPEFFTLQLDDAPAGRYGLRVSVLDRNAGVRLSSSRTFEIEEPEE